MADLGGDDAMAVDGGDMDIAAEVLSLFQSSTRDDHQHLCATAAAISQSLREEEKPLSPVSYFSASAAAVAKLAADPVAATSSPAVTAAILAFLSSHVIPKTPVPVMRSRGLEVAKDVARVISLSSPLPEIGVKAGILCISRLIVAGEKGSWGEIEPLYKVLLGFATDRRPKVRKQSHACLQDILQSFQKQAVLVPASEVLTRDFERYLLLAGGSSSTNAGAAEEKATGAMEVLFMLNALKCCLTLMASKSANIILKYFKTLLDLRQPIVTRNILDILRSVSNSAALDLSSELLLDLVCSLGMTVCEEKSGDEMAAVAHLLLSGTRKIYDSNKNICTIKLPLIFNYLGDILASVHEEAVFAAREALKGLIYSCICESLIDQSVTQIKDRIETSKAVPTVIEKICATFEGFLHVRYAPVLDSVFDVISVAFDKLGESSRYLMSDILLNLVDMQNLPDEDFPYRKQLYACIGSAVAAMGPENFFSILQVQTISEDNAWLLPILKQWIVGSNLSFFTKHILAMIRVLQKSIPKLISEDKIFSAKRAEGYVYSLWSLLPSFCNYPRDMMRSFGTLQSVLCEALCSEPNFRSIICSSIQVLIKQNRDILSGLKQGDIVSNSVIQLTEKRAKESYTEKVAQDNLGVLQTFSAKLLHNLRLVFLEAWTESSQNLLVAIHEIASISEKSVVSKSFRSTMKKLLVTTQEAIDANKTTDLNAMQIDATSNDFSMKRALLLDFAASLMPGLSADEVDLLFSSVKPALKDQDGLIQKRAYKILSLVMKDSDQFIKRNLDALSDLMVESLPCHVSSKRYRLECLYQLIVYILKDSLVLRKRDVVCSFLTEILLALKEANKKTRNRAYDLIVEIGRACHSEQIDERTENLHQFFNMVAGGLASQTPHSISASVRGLARLTYEFSELLGVAYKLLPSTFLLLQRKNREVIKENLSFLKVLVVKSSSDVLHEHLKGILEGLLNWQDDSKKSFKAKIKYLIEMMVKKCGLDAVKAVMPEEHMRLLTNIRKIKERKERKAKSSDGDSMTSKTSISRTSGWNHTKIFSDFGDGDESEDGQSDFKETKSFNSRAKSSARPGSKAMIKRKRDGKGLQEDLDGELNDNPLDLLDQRVVRSSLHSTLRAEHKDSSDDELEIDPEGKLIIKEESTRTKKKKSSDKDLDTRSIGSRSAATSAATKTNKRRKTAESGWAYTGHEYASSKASGDARKDGKLEPYAYWPLDRKLLNRRAERKAVARKGMAKVMKVTKGLEGKSSSVALSMTRSKAIRKQQKKHKKSR